MRRRFGTAGRDDPDDQLAVADEVLDDGSADARDCLLQVGRGQPVGGTGADEVGQGSGPGELGGQQCLLGCTEVELEADQSSVERRGPLDGENPVGVDVESVSPVLDEGAEDGGAFAIGPLAPRLAANRVDPGEKRVGLRDGVRRSREQRRSVLLQHEELRLRAGHLRPHRCVQRHLALLPLGDVDGRQRRAAVHHLDHSVAFPQQVRVGSRRARDVVDAAFGQAVQLLGGPVERGVEVVDHGGQVASFGSRGRGDGDENGGSPIQIPDQRRGRPCEAMAHIGCSALECASGGQSGVE